MNYKENIRLLKIAKNNVNNYRTGLCSTFVSMYKKCITEKEFNILLSLIKRNKPLKTYVYNSNFYFEPYKTKPRLEYLEHLILLNNPNFFIRLYYKFKFRKLYTYKLWNI
jgi:hypothetical protein